MSPAADRALTQIATDLLAHIKITGTREEKIKIVKRRLKQQWIEGWQQGHIDEREARRAKRKRDHTPSELKAALNAPVTEEDRLREVLETHDPVTKTWAALIAPTICRLQAAFHIPQDELLDWIYSSENPVDVFEFSAWARQFGQPHAKVVAIA